LCVKNIHVRIHEAFLNRLLGVDDTVLIEVLENGLHVSCKVALCKSKLIQAEESEKQKGFFHVLFLTQLE
jgi:hypothetical protein